MARIQRVSLAENVPEGLDLGITRPGKIIIQNVGSNSALIGYDYGDVLAATANAAYYTLTAGITLVFDCGPEIGWISQGQLMWFNATGGSTTLEIWVADSL